MAGLLLQDDFEKGSVLFESQCIRFSGRRKERMHAFTSS